MESEAEMVDGFVVVGNAKMVVDTNAVANFSKPSPPDTTH